MQRMCHTTYLSESNKGSWNMQWYGPIPYTSSDLTSKVIYYQKTHNCVFKLTCSESTMKLFWSVRCLSVRPSVCKRFTFHLHLQNHRTSFHKTWHKEFVGKVNKSLFIWWAMPIFIGKIISKYRYFKDETLVQFWPILAQFFFC